MAKLTSSERKALPRSEFALPGGRFPIPDANHARAALIDVGRAKGLKPGQAATVRRKAKAELSGNDRDGDKDEPVAGFGSMARKGA